MALATVALLGFAAADESVKELTGYRLRDTAINYHDFNLWVITSEDAFSETFVPEHEAVTRPQFDTEMVLAAKVKTFSWSYKPRFKRVVPGKNELNVYFTVQKADSVKDGNDPLSLAVFPKSKAFRKVNFYHDHVLVKSVPIVSVY